MEREVYSMKINFMSLLLLLQSQLFFSACNEKKKEDTNLIAAAALLSSFSMAGDCSIAAGRRTLNAFTTDTTGSNPKSGNITSSSRVPVVGHIASVLKLEASSGTRITTTGNSFAILYKSNSCPLSESNRQTIGTGFSLGSGATDSDSEFTGSHKISGSGSIVITQAGTYYYLYYQIPSSGQTTLPAFAITAN